MANAVEIAVRARDYASEIFERLQNVGVTAGERIAGSMDEVGQEARQMENRVDDAMEGIERSAEDAEDSIEELADAAEKAAKEMEDAAEEQKDAMQGVTEGIGMAGAAMTAFAEIQQDAIVRMDKFAYLTDMSDKSVSKLVSSVSDASFGLNETITVLEKGRKEGLKGEEQLRNYADGWKTVAKATGLEAEELMEFAPILKRANASIGEGTEAMDAFGWVLTNTAASVPEFMDAINGSMVDIGDAEISLDKMAAALKIVENIYGVTGPEAIAVFQAKIGEAAGAVDENGNELGWSMETFADAIGTTTSEIDKMATSVEGSNKVMHDLAGITDENATLFDKVMAKVGQFTAQHGDAIQVMGSFGTIMSGLTPVILLAMNAQAIYTTVTTAATGATTAFGAAITFLTGPVGLVILAVMALIGVGYLLIKHWDKVKEVAAAVWDGIVTIAEKAWELLKKGAVLAFKALTFQWRLMYFGVKKGIEWVMDIGPKMWDGIKNAGKFAFDFIKGYWSNLGDFLSNIFQGAIKIIKAPFNFFIDGINKITNGLNNLNIKVPNWVPMIGGKEFGFNIPSIPRLHTGGVFNAPVGQREGLALLKQGEMVLDPMASRKEINNSNNDRPQIIRIELDGRVLAEVTGKSTQDTIILRGG